MACENIKPPNMARIIMVRKSVNIMATTLFIFLRTKKLTTGCSKIAMMIEKMNGTIMF